MFIQRKSFNKLILLFIVIAVSLAGFLIFFLGRNDEYPGELVNVDEKYKQVGKHSVYKEKDDKRYIVLHTPSLNVNALDQAVSNHKEQLQKRFESDKGVKTILMDYKSFQYGDCISVEVTSTIVNMDDSKTVEVFGLSGSKQDGELYDMSKLVSTKGLRVISHDVRKQLPAYTNENRMNYLRRTNPQPGSFNQFFIDEDSFIFYVETPAGEKTTVKIAQDRLTPYLETSLGSIVKNEKGKQESYYLETGADAKEKLIAFTFDDGPRPENDRRIIDILKKYDGQATFFMLGLELKKHPEMVNTLADEGYQLGNHSYNHVKFEGLSDSESLMQLSSVSDIIHSQMDYDYPIMFRPPYGHVNKQEMHRYNMPLIMWNVDSDDWRNKTNPSASVETVLNTCSENSIVLFHDIYSSTIDSFEIIAEKLHQQGYKFVTVDELLRANNIPVNPGEIYYNGD